MSLQPHPELDEMLGRDLFEAVPSNVAVIDREFRVVKANRNFRELFGDWEGRHCHEVLKGDPDKCAHCRARDTFDDGQVRVSNDDGPDRNPPLAAAI